MSLDIDRLVGGLTPADPADPRTFPAIWNETADEIEAVEGRVSTNEGDISSLDGRVSTNEGDISSLDGRVTTNEGDIAQLQTDVGNLDTDDIPEGSANLYFEDGRADARIAAASIDDLGDVDTAGVNDGDLLLYDGTAGEWKPGAVVGGGGLVAVKQALKTDTQEELNVSSGSNFAVDGLSITHEVADASNRLIISAFFGAAASTHGFGTVGIAVHDGTGLIAVGDAASNRTRVTAGGSVSDIGANYVVTMPSVTFVHTPGAGSKTYTVHAINIRGSTATLYINRSEVDNNASSRPRAVSSLVIQEVSV